PASRRGAIAQLGERLHGMQEVGGSIPPGSTTFPAVRAPGRREPQAASASPSSRGLGHNPFTVATGVRIPVGTPLLNNARASGRCCLRTSRRPYDPDRLCSGGMDPSSTRPAHAADAVPRPVLRPRDAFAITIGIVVGAGIFRMPSLVAGASASEAVMLAAWLAGGLLSIAGALCYAELATAFPRAGGDYSYLRRAYGPRLAFLYGWARLAVIQTGSVALLAFVVGDYMAQIFDLGPWS